MLKFSGRKKKSQFIFLKENFKNMMEYLRIYYLLKMKFSKLFPMFFLNEIQTIGSK